MPTKRILCLSDELMCSGILARLTTAPLLCNACETSRALAKLAINGELWRALIQKYWVFGLCPFLRRSFRYTPTDRHPGWKLLFSRVYTALSDIDHRWRTERDRTWRRFEQGQAPSLEQTRRMFRQPRSQLFSSTRPAASFEAFSARGC